MRPKTSVASRIGQAIDFIGQWPAILALLLMIVMVFGSVVTRYLGYPLQFVEQYGGYLLAVMVFLSGGYFTKRGQQIIIDVVTAKLKPRPRAYLEIATSLVSLAVIGLIFFTTTQLVSANFKSGTKDYGMVETPLAPIQLIMPIGFALFIIETINIIIRKVVSLVRPVA